MRIPLAAALALGAAGGCGPGACLELPAECTPQYEPTFDAVYANTLETSCALGGCHGGDSTSGGLAMGSSPDAAYGAILDRLTPGDPACSDLVDRIEPAGTGDMPPGAALSEEERCAIRTWIAEGAQR